MCRSRTMQLVIYSESCEEAESGEWRRTSARSLSSSLKSGDTNFCSPASKRVLGEIYHFCPRECEIYAHTSVSQICTSYRRTQVFSRKCRSGRHSGTWNRKFRSLPSYVTAHCQLLHCNKRASSRWLHHALFLIGEPSSWQVKPAVFLMPTRLVLLTYSSVLAGSPGGFGSTPQCILGKRQIA